MARNEKLIAEELTQSGQLGAHCRLADLKPLCSASHVAFGHESFEGDKEIEVYALGIHFLDSTAKLFTGSQGPLQARQSPHDQLFPWSEYVKESIAGARAS